MSRVGDRHPLLAPLRLHGRDVEDEICSLDATGKLLQGVGTFVKSPAVLSEGIAHPARLQVALGYLNLPAHGHRLAPVLAVWMRIARLEEYLVLLAFPAKSSAGELFVSALRRG